MKLIKKWYKSFMQVMNTPVNASKMDWLGDVDGRK